MAREYRMPDEIRALLDEVDRGAGDPGARERAQTTAALRESILLKLAEALDTLGRDVEAATMRSRINQEPNHVV